jgi:ATP-dependent exoDNAse (exonuclease V) alpha subunit
VTAVDTPGAVVELTEKQRRVAQVVGEGDGHLLVTGRAGTGKSTLLEHIVATTERRVVVCAPTGVAALNVGGQTIHSLFKLPIGLIGPTPLVQDRPLQKLLSAIDVLIIDEISMVSADLLDAVDRSLRLARARKEPFGGVQVVLFGDPYQLAPVPGSAEERAYYTDVYRSMWFFDAKVWEETDLGIVELDLIHRQRDEEFRSLLTAVRHGRVTAEMAARLNGAGARPLPDDAPLTLASRNDTVAAINRAALAKLPGREAVSLAEVEGDFGGRTFPADEELRLKEGAHVMMLRNDADGRWVNGSMGVVSRIRPRRLTVEIDGVDHDVEPVGWERHRYAYSPGSKELRREVVAEFRQLPVRLGWAVTIHKSQGKTFDAARIDLGRQAFSPGQTYVALSRLTSLDGLYLTRPLRPGDVIVDPDVRRWMGERRAAARAAAEAAAAGQ